LYLEGAQIFYLFAARVVLDHARRESFAIEQYVVFLQEEMEGDNDRLRRAVDELVPEGVAGKLLTNARRLAKWSGAAPRLHPAWSTSFCTATEETPFLVIQFSSAEGDATQSIAAYKAAVSRVDAALLLASSSDSLFRCLIQVVKADHDTIVLIATRRSDEKDDYDEVRSSDLLRFVAQLRAYRPLLLHCSHSSDARRSPRSLTAALSSPLMEWRVVLSSGPLMGSVVGTSSLSFEFYGAPLSRAMYLCRHVMEWGSVFATDRFLHLASLHRSRSSSTAAASKLGGKPPSTDRSAPPHSAAVSAASESRSQLLRTLPILPIRMCTHSAKLRGSFLPPDALSVYRSLVDSLV
jgi:hypothetical protein